MKLNQKGVAGLLVIILLALVMGVGGFVMVRVITASQGGDDVVSQNSTAPTQTKQEAPEPSTEKNQVDPYTYIELLDLKFINSLGKDLTFVGQDVVYKREIVRVGFGSKRFSDKVSAIGDDGRKYCQTLVSVARFAKPSDVQIEGTRDEVYKLELSNGFFVIFRPQVSCLPFVPEGEDRYAQFDDERVELTSQIIKDLRKFEVVD